MKNNRLLSCLIMALTLLLSLPATAFEGSDLTSGQKFYLFNIYQSKFLGADNKLQAPNIGTPVAFTASASGFTIGGTTYTATKNAAGFYQLKNGSNFYAFEDKVNAPNSPTDENRRMYLGGGVTCQNTTNDTDRSYWQLISETEYAEWQAKKKFTVASLNVDGMPKSVKVAGVYTVNLNPDATEGPGATRIGNKLRESGFDVVGVSEDFNYHSELWNAAWNNGQGVHYNATTHRGSISAGLGAVADYLAKRTIFEIDGLGLFYRINGETTIATPSQESWTKWNDHNGFDDQGGDGLIEKGYRFYVITLADGTQFDLYTMHMDAESGEGDCNARASQLTQLVNAIKATHNGRPIVIIGDSNCRYTRDKVKSNLIDAINADERFTIRDPWIMFGRNNTYPTYGSSSIMADANGYRTGEVVDKIWFINNTESNIRLTAETYHQDLSFVDESGSPLCDHKPCVVTFSYHDYDPVIDDVAIVETTEEAVYLRNRATGRFLKSGGAWGTHSIVGNYPLGIYLTKNNGKYALKTLAGYITSQVGDEAQSFVDGGDAEERSVKDWTILEKDGYKIFTRNGRALSANDPYFFNDDPNYRWVILDNLNEDDKLQQWEILTKEEMMAEMNKATALSPYNATWLLSNPNFDRNLGTTGWENSISSSATRMTSNLGGNGQNTGGPTDNMVAEAFVSSTSKTGSYSTTWDINQTLTGIPNGWYRITCQAFQRISNSNTTTATIQLYGQGGATEAAQQVELMYNLKTITETGMGSKKDGNYYYPDNMAEAALYFNAGYYQNAILVQVTDGTLKVGIRKTSDTGKSYNAWTCFDNFQLIYLGTEAPESTYYLENVESGMFLTSGYDYDARAVLSTTGKAWTPKYLSSGLSLVCDGKGGNLGIATDGKLGTFVDWRNTEPWHTEIDANGAITLEQANKRGNYIGWTSESHGDFVCDRSQISDRELNDAIHWKAMTASEYNSHASTAAARKAAVGIYRAATISGIDTDEFAAAWHNPNTSASDITTKAKALKTALETEAADKASDSKTYNFSHYITNATCGDADHTGWTKTGDWGSQIVVNNSYTNNGLWLAPRFYEKFNAEKLPDAKISQTISNLPAGYYKLALDVNAEKQSDANAAITGTLLYAKAGSAERVTTACDTHGDGVLIQTFETPEFMVNADESVEIGLSLENTNANWVAFDNWQLIYLGPIYTANMTVKEGKYATFVAPFEVTLPAGVTAYTATLEGKIVNLAEIDDSNLPAGTPVVLGGTAVNENFTGKRPADKMVSDGTLVGFYWNYDDDNDCVINGDGYSYVLQTQNDYQAFYKVKEETTFKGSANRCYLVAPHSDANVLRFGFDDEETAITEIDNEKMKIENCIFDLSGRKIGQSQMKKGLYIINGRKVVK